MISIILCAGWLVAANVVAMLPTRDQHWTAAYILIAIGLPLLGVLIWQNGIVLGIIALIAGMSVLRWPVIYLTRWIRGKLGG